MYTYAHVYIMRLVYYCRNIILYIVFPPAAVVPTAAKNYLRTKIKIYNRYLHRDFLLIVFIIRRPTMTIIL